MFDALRLNSSLPLFAPVEKYWGTRTHCSSYCWAISVHCIHGFLTCYSNPLRNYHHPTPISTSTCNPITTSNIKSSLNDTNTCGFCSTGLLFLCSSLIWILRTIRDCCKRCLQPSLLSNCAWRGRQ